MEYKITEDKREMAQLGRRIMADNPRRYPAAMREEFLRVYREILPDEERLSEIFYCAVYCQQLYGTSILEYAMYGFENRSHEQKTQYLTWFSRYLYMAFLNKDRDLHLLDNKFEAYTLLKPFYKREAILLGGEEDFGAFCDFASRHGRIFVKPVNLDLAEGVHRLVVGPDADLRAVFDGLLSEAAALVGGEITRPVEHRLILEEEIVQSDAMAQFNPREMSLLRVTTIVVKGKVHFFHPCVRMMCGDGQGQRGEVYSIDALVDAESGEILTDGIDYFGTHPLHPVSGLRIKGIRLPDWQDLLSMLEEAALRFPTLRYIGWDVTHAAGRGWCIVEGNTNGEFNMAQMCLGRGLKPELEDLIGFHLPYGFLLERVEQLVENRKIGNLRESLA